MVARGGERWRGHRVRGGREMWLWDEGDGGTHSGWAALVNGEGEGCACGKWGRSERGRVCGEVGRVSVYRKGKWCGERGG